MKMTINAVKAGIVVCAVLLIQSCTSDKNQEMTGDFYNPDNTTIKYPCSVYQSGVRTQLESVLSSTIANNIPNNVNPQNVKVEWDDDSDSEAIIFTFSPAEERIDIVEADDNSRAVDPSNPGGVSGIGKNTVYSPSMISLNKTLTVKLPYTKHDKNIQFSGAISTEYFDYDIAGNIIFANSNFDLSDAGNELAITINSQKLKSDYGWCKYNQFADGSRNYQTYWVTGNNTLDGLLSNTGWNCELSGVSLDYIQQLGFSTEQFFNLIFNLKDADGNEIGNIFDTKGVVFDPSGNLWLSDKINSEIYLHNGYLQFPQLKYSPSAVRYIPMSADEIMLFGFPTLLKGFLNYDYQNNQLKQMLYTARHTSQYIKLLKSLSVELPKGIRLTKSTVSNAANANDSFVLTFDNEVGRKILSLMIEPLADNSYREKFINAVTAIYPSVSRSDLDSALLQLPVSIENASEVKLGISMEALSGGLM